MAAHRLLLFLNYHYYYYYYYYFDEIYFRVWGTVSQVLLHAMGGLEPKMVIRQ